MNTKEKIICAVFIVSSIKSFSQNIYFEGKITYRHKSLSKEGKRELFPIDTEETYFHNNQIVNRVTSGFIKERVGNKPIYLDTDKMLRYQIDNDGKVINDLGLEKHLELITPLEFKKLDDDKVLGESCNVYYIKFIHAYDSLSMDGNKNTIDTLGNTYYISKSMKIKNHERIPYLTRSTKFIDGRFDGVPIKIISKSWYGSQFVIEAIKIDRMDVSKIVELPNYPIRN